MTHPCDRELESIMNGFGIHEDILPWTKLLLAPVLINIDVLLMRLFSIVHVCLSVRPGERDPSSLSSKSQNKFFLEVRGLGVSQL